MTKKAENQTSRTIRLWQWSPSVPLKYWLRRFFVSLNLICNYNQTNYTKWRDSHSQWTLQLCFEVHNLIDKLHNEIRKLVANFGNFKQTSQTVCQKCCETHCKSKQSFGFAVFLLAIGTALNLTVLISFNPSISLCLRASSWVCLPCE